MKLAIVIPWFGRELRGGAEQHAWQIAARLAQRGHPVEVLTTCCRSHQDDWETNHLLQGRSDEPEGFAIRRFPVDQRDKKQFDRVAARLMNMPAAALIPHISPVSESESAVFVNELIKSAALESYLCAHRGDYDGFVLLPYLYGLVIHGVSAVADRACLQPCLHNEAYAYLPEVADAFYKAASILFISEGEAELAAGLYGPAVTAKSVITGAGVETRDEQFATTDPLTRERFVLYLGRKDPGKNTDLLVRAFTRFRRVRPNSNLRLVLAGHGKVELNGAADWVSDRGLVSDADKELLLSRCLALAQPSRNESFSRVLMEAWRYGKPVAANRACLATASEVARADGGWLAESEDEWAAWLVTVDRAQPADLERLGANGKRHADVLSNWDRVMDRYERALAHLKRPPPARKGAKGKATRSINQFLPNLSYGDAISNHALWIRGELRKLGYRSDIYVRFIDPRVGAECNLFTEAALRDSDAAIYHHSIGSEITPRIIGYHRPKCLIYHNITPAEFVEPYRPLFADILRQGRRELKELPAHFQLAYGVSRYNADELASVGFPNTGVLPICVDPRKWNFQPDPALLAKLSDGRTNVIFVGRIAPNKRQDHLVRAFACYLALDPNARLFLIGMVERDDPYAEYLLDEIQTLGISDSVTVTGGVSDQQLAAYYRSAHLFWSMSEHEGFCVPLVEAMWFDLPIIAYSSSAVPETLGSASVMFSDGSDVAGVAGLANLLVTDTALREKLINSQRVQRRRFLPDRVAPQLRSLAFRLQQERRRAPSAPDRVATLH